MNQMQQIKNQLNFLTLSLQSLIDISTNKDGFKKMEFNQCYNINLTRMIRFSVLTIINKISKINKEDLLTKIDKSLIEIYPSFYVDDNLNLIEDELKEIYDIDVTVNVNDSIGGIIKQVFHSLKTEYSV